MGLRVECFAQYLTGPHQMRDDDYAGQRFVKALKGETVYRSSVIPINGENFHLTAVTAPQAVAKWAIWAAGRIRARTPPPIVIVPVPNSHVVISTQKFRTLDLATDLATTLGDGAIAVGAFAWDQPMSPARKGGPRDAWQLYPHLVVRKPLSPMSRCVLLDDVCTSGGHLQACAAKLVELGHTVEMAVCGAKTFDTQQPKPFDLPSIDLQTFHPATLF